MGHDRAGVEIKRRALIEGLSAVVLLAACGPVRSQQAPRAGVLRSLAVLDVELVDDHENPLTRAAQEQRLARSGTQLRAELAARQLYRVVDEAPSVSLQRTLRSQQAFLYRCDDCAQQVGTQLGVDLVMTPWVQKVSELILNLNVQIYDVRAGAVAFTKSVDMRGNNDESWTRAVSYLVRGIAERRERDPRYGQ
jgi:Protein of unknown function (DUF2380)